MKRMLLCLALLCLMGGNALADVLYIDAGNADRVHLREEASSDSKSYGLYFSGTPVEAKAQIGDFTVVSIFMENGFIKTEYLTADPSGIDSALRVGTVHTGAGYINMRKYAGDSPVITTVPDGDTVTVMGETASGWYYVAYGGRYGYMKRSLVRLGGPAAQSTLRETLDLQAGGSRITVELHETGGGEFEREYHIRFLQNGTEIAAAGFFGGQLCASEAF